MRRPFEIISAVFICVIVLLLALLLAWRTFFQTQLLNKESKLALAAMHDSIQLNDPEEGVLSVYERFATTRTWLRRDIFEDTWRVDMPLEFGATDWMLYIQFDGSNRVSAVSMRTSDGLYSWPSDSPGDKGELSKPKQ